MHLTHEHRIGNAGNYAAEALVSCFCQHLEASVVVMCKGVVSSLTQDGVKGSILTNLFHSKTSIWPNKERGFETQAKADRHAHYYPEKASWRPDKGLNFICRTTLGVTKRRDRVTGGQSSSHNLGNWGPGMMQLLGPPTTTLMQSKGNDYKAKRLDLGSSDDAQNPQRLMSARSQTASEVLELCP